MPVPSRRTILRVGGALLAVHQAAAQTWAPPMTSRSCLLCARRVCDPSWPRSDFCRLGEYRPVQLRQHLGGAQFERCGGAERELASRTGAVQTAGDELEAGTNTVLVTHRPDIIDALGKEWFEVKEGEASIFALENGKLLLLARGQMAAGSRIAAAWKR